MLFTITGIDLRIAEYSSGSHDEFAFEFIVGLSDQSHKTHGEKSIHRDYQGNFAFQPDPEVDVEMHNFSPPPTHFIVIMYLLLGSRLRNFLAGLGLSHGPSL